ncbi:hypothetical protein RRG08_008556 [Elysia crispata]|uniref:Uncharacterized protein n=1 Tax=Elysia crispata TaxID=231223 RepID=A0AAE0YML7_9GAST|nr:hypothetical protein RRG08_008556 [Elysia crispata]
MPSIHTSRSDVLATTASQVPSQPSSLLARLKPGPPGFDSLMDQSSRHLKPGQRSLLALIQTVVKIKRKFTSRQAAVTDDCDRKYDATC